MPAPSPAPTLDDAVSSARSGPSNLGRTRALYLLSTGAGLLADRLAERSDVTLGDLAGTPEGWRDSVLVTGKLGDLACWLVDDPGVCADDDPRWGAGFPCWLAAACGARVLVHASAGCGLEGGPERGTLAFLTDHLRFGDRNPLLGLGQSQLGPLFPDLSRLHDARLRRGAIEQAEALGLSVVETVGATTAGPSIDTPAERRLLAGLGAGLVVQGAAASFLAAGHAGLAVLSIVAVTDDGAGGDLEDILAASEALAPGLDDLCAALAGDVDERARALDRERSS